LIIVEEGTSYASAGAEIIAGLHERIGGAFRVLRLGKLPAPIPSAPALEKLALPNVNQLCHRLEALLELNPS
jgi:pyruvate/2-oxoglutarate/acetoin dehydrogenase E1 component